MGRGGSVQHVVLAIGLAAVVPRSASPATPADEAPRSALVKIYGTFQAPDYSRPWSTGPVFSATGSGCVIPGRRILTNAHVVSDQAFLQVRRNGQAQKHEARVLYVSHEADLALLTVEDPRFFEGVTALEIGDLPAVRQPVTVLGFPAGGDTLSVTQGIVSRIEHQSYIHSGMSLLAGQIDAAINPGNSGGPVLDGRRVVGVAMQKYPSLDNVAYMVPAPVVQRFLQDVSDGRYDGLPALGVRWQALENPALKRRQHVPAGETGVVVTAVYPGSPAAAALRRNDVLLSVEGRPIADDGTVEFRAGERTVLEYFIDSHQVGDGVRVAFVRDGERRSATLALRWQPGAGSLVGAQQHDTKPSYFVFGGVVFVPLTVNYLQSLGPEWYRDAPPRLLAALGDVPEAAGQQVVVITQVLAAELNEGYHDVAGRVVSEVDGTRPRNLRHLVALLDKGASELLSITCDGGQQIVLDRAQARAAGARILERYQISADRSPDLRNP